MNKVLVPLVQIDLHDVIESIHYGLLSLGPARRISAEYSGKLAIFVVFEILFKVVKVIEFLNKK